MIQTVGFVPPICGLLIVATITLAAAWMLA
jgi:hypothetical protein